VRDSKAARSSGLSFLLKAKSPRRQPEASRHSSNSHVNSIMGKHSDNPQSNRPSLLIVVEGNRFLRAFADKDVQIRFVETPFLESQEGERLVEEYLELRLPHYWKRVFTEGRPVGIHPIRPTTAGSIALREFDIEFSRCLDRVESILQGGKTK